jgi:hypothetical protein
MITYGMLARQIILPRHSPGLNSFAPILLPPLEISCLSFCSAFPLFSTACSLFFQNTRGGGYLVRFVLVSASALRSLRLRVIVSLRSLSPLCFHNLTNCLSRNSLLFTSMQIARGVGAQIQEKNPWQTRVPLRPLSPFNAVFRHSMHGNTVQRNVWCRKAKFGRLDT